MPMAPTFENNMIKMLMWQTGAQGGSGIPTIADNSANLSTAPATQFWVSLHTAQPTSDSQASNEAAYGGYARQSIARSSAGFNFTAATSGGSGAFMGFGTTLAFPQSNSSSTEVETYVGIGLSSAGVGTLLFAGALNPIITISGLNVTPKLSTGTQIQIT